MHPRDHAARNPDRTAMIFIGETETALSYAELEARANAMAHTFRSLGLGPGGVLGMVVENRAEFIVIAWAAQRAGLCLVPIQLHLTDAEVAYIIEDSGTDLLVLTEKRRAVLEGLARRLPKLQMVTLDAPVEGIPALPALMQGMPETPIADECVGSLMQYSSGTTGGPRASAPSPNPARSKRRRSWRSSPPTSSA